MLKSRNSLLYPSLNSDVIKHVNREFRIRVYYPDGTHGLKGAGMIEPILGKNITLIVFNKALECRKDTYTYKLRNSVTLKFLSK